MKLTILFALAFALHAEDAKPTVEQLQAQLTAKDQQITFLQKKLGIYQQGLFSCQDAQIDQQAKQPAQPPRPAKPEPPKQGDGKP